MPFYRVEPQNKKAFFEAIGILIFKLFWIFDNNLEMVTISNKQFL